jgi:uncharacterized protein involved in exopolysaccharide biosynthesis
MLQQLSQQDHTSSEQPGDQFLTPEYFYDVVKRRWLYFVIPFALIFAIGAVVTALLPATFVSQGTMLIESQEIPADLVQPTVSTVAAERVALLQQRMMVRDKLLAIASKYHLAELAKTDQLLGRWLPEKSSTDIVDMMRDRAQITPVKNDIPARPGQRQFIAFTVSYEHERPEVARQVTNELVTTILDEDVRARTNSAFETTRFLEREANRLNTDLNSLELKIADAKAREVGTPIAGDSASVNSPKNQLATLEAELVVKSAIYSDSHPDIKALKLRIAALEKLVTKPSDKPSDKPNEKMEVSFDALERQRDSIKENLEGVSKKLSVARLGENLERGQHSERLSVIEQPTLPLKPARPNRPKILAVVFAMAIAAGGGLVFLVQMLDGTIRRNADIAKLIDSQLIVSIPFITTKADLIHQKFRRTMVAIGCSVGVVLAGLVAAIYLLPKFGKL